jgi:hypothetical protein
MDSRLRGNDINGPISTFCETINLPMVQAVEQIGDCVHDVLIMAGIVILVLATCLFSITFSPALPGDGSRLPWRHPWRLGVEPLRLLPCRVFLTNF